MLLKWPTGLFESFAGTLYGNGKGRSPRNFEPRIGTSSLRSMFFGTPGERS